GGGGGPLGGQVVIQTYAPGHYAIQAAARHDYGLFYSQEILYRRQLHDPPFSRLVSMIYQHTNDARCQQEAERMKRLLHTERDARGLTLDILGPAPAFVHRLRGKFRWQLILRGTAPAALLAHTPVPQGWSVDIDPASMV
ncbi:MAG: primosomal protein N', partial [Chloroflexi bacterium]|nr:primosomal protein N' [Chloroflexota bacterium]